MSRQRKFTAAFKSQVVLQMLSGEKNIVELCREHQLTSQMIDSWKQQFLAAAPAPSSTCAVPGAGSRSEHLDRLSRYVLH